MLRPLSKFASAKRGNVALIFAFAVIPFLVLAGFAIDIGRAILVREKLGQSIDAAILAVGASPQLTNEEAQQFGEEFFQANFNNPLGALAHDIDVVVTGDVVHISARADVPTTLLALLNHESIGLYQEAEATRGGQDLELVMVLDNTGSMAANDKIGALRAAASEATEILFRAGSDPDSVKIGLVPFASTVNVGTGYERAWWLDPNAQSPAHHDPHTWNADINRWDVFDELDVAWAGCVESRAEPYDMDDTTPNAAQPATLFVPYFAADVPGNRNSASSGFTDSHSWIADGQYTRAMTLGSPNTGIPLSLLPYKALGLLGMLGLGFGDQYGAMTPARQAYVGKYYENTQTPYGDGPNRDCIDQAIFPMSTDEQAILDQIDDMQASGNTNIPNGISWGVRVLSQNAPYTDGRPWGDEELVKAMIVLTDGENVMTGQNNYNMSSYNTYGYIAEGRFGVTTSDSNALGDRLDQKTSEVCEYAKELGTRVYTISFQIADQDTLEMLEDCASEDENGDPLYWDSPSTAQLENIFVEIARDLVELRLSR